MEINFAHNHADFTNFMQIPDGLLHPICIINGYILPKLISVLKILILDAISPQHFLFPADVPVPQAYIRPGCTAHRGESLCQ